MSKTLLPLCSKTFKGHLNIPENVSLHDRCPFITSSLTWGGWDSVLRKCPLIIGRPLIVVSLEDRFYCTIKCIGHSIHTNSGLQETRIPQRLKESQSVIFGLELPMHYHPQSSRNKSLVHVCTHMHSMNQKLTNEHICTNIGIHSPPNT